MTMLAGCYVVERDEAVPCDCGVETGSVPRERSVHPFPHTNDFTQGAERSPGTRSGSVPTTNHRVSRWSHFVANFHAGDAPAGGEDPVHPDTQQ